jgi:hypothetical protein
VDQLSGHQESPVSGRARERQNKPYGERGLERESLQAQKDNRATGMENKGLGRLKPHAIRFRNDNSNLAESRMPAYEVQGAGCATPATAAMMEEG